MRFLLFTLFAFLTLSSLSAKEGHEIKIKVDNFSGESIVLGHYAADKQYIDDTLSINKKGFYISKGTEALKSGIYLILLPPDNNYFQILIDQEEQHFSAFFDADAPILNANFKQSIQNTAFYDYLKFMDAKRKESAPLREHYKTDPKAKIAYDKITAEIKGKQDETILNTTGKLVAKVMQASQDVQLPEALKKADADQVKKYLYYKSHFFDNIDLSDDRLFRTPFLFKRIEYYIDKLTPQHPDSLALSIDRILAPMDKSGDMYRFYVAHMLNQFAKSKIIGFDAVYVHMVEEYYSKEKTPWIEEEQLEKILGDAKKLKPLLIGKTAPDVVLMGKDKKTSQLHQIESPYIIFYIWDPDCGHCKKQTPKMKEVAEKYKDKGVKFIGICNKSYKEEKKCWDYLEKNGLMEVWDNYYDPYLRYKKPYNVVSTPIMYLLDKDKKILQKRLSADQIPEVLDRILKPEGK